MANPYSKFPMYYNASVSIRENAKVLRTNETKAEKLLWQYLKDKQLNGLKFRRQHAIDQFIADFYCHTLKLVIEIDGEIHTIAENKEYDANRTYELMQYGIKVIRFTNQEIDTNIEKVLKQIKEVCNELKN